MRFKRQTALGLIGLMLWPAEAYALNISDINKNPITVTGITDSGLEAAAAVKDIDGIFYFYDELVSDEDGNYILNFELPEDLVNKTIEVQIRPRGKAEEKISFSFSGEKIRAGIIRECVEAVTGKNKAVLEEIFLNKEYNIALEMLGISLEALNLNISVRGGAIDLICENGTTENTFISDFNKYFFVSSKKNNYQNGAEKSFDGSNFIFGSVTYQEEKDSIKKAWVKEKMLALNDIKTLEQAQANYSRMNVYYLINNAKYTDIPELIEKYKNELGIAGTDSYTNFSLLDSADKYKAAEKLVNMQGFGNLTDGIDKMLSEAVTAIKQNSSGSDNSRNPGGGSSHKKDNSAAGVVVPEKITDEKVIEQNKNIFDDVSNDAWYCQAVKALNARGIVTGKSEKLFAPDDDIKREEFLAMLIRALGKDGIQSDRTLTYNDVIPGAWYENAVKTAVDIGLAAGYNDELFGIGDCITRQDAAVFAARAAEFTGSALNYEKDALFEDDSDISSYAKDYVYAMKNEKIISGMGNNKYLPQAQCTRAQAAVIVYNLFGGEKS